LASALAVQHIDGPEDKMPAAAAAAAAVAEVGKSHQDTAFAADIHPDTAVAGVEDNLLHKDKPAAAAGTAAAASYAEHYRLRNNLPSLFVNAGLPCCFDKEQWSEDEIKMLARTEAFRVLACALRPD